MSKRHRDLFALRDLSHLYPCFFPSVVRARGRPSGSGRCNAFIPARRGRESKRKSEMRTRSRSRWQEIIWKGRKYRERSRLPQKREKERTWEPVEEMNFHPRQRISARVRSRLDLEEFRFYRWVNFLRDYRPEAKPRSRWGEGSTFRSNV